MVEKIAMDIFEVKHGSRSHNTETKLCQNNFRSSNSLENMMHLEMVDWHKHFHQK